MNEKLIDRKLCEGIKARGGIALKLTSLTFTGMPDRTVLLPVNFVCWVEVKTTGKPLRPRQAIVIAMLRKMGFTVYVIDSQEGLDAFFTDIDKRPQ